MALCLYSANMCTFSLVVWADLTLQSKIKTVDCLKCFTGLLTLVIPLPDAFQLQLRLQAKLLITQDTSFKTFSSVLGIVYKCRYIFKSNNNNNNTSPYDNSQWFQDFILETVFPLLHITGGLYSQLAPKIMDIPYKSLSFCILICLYLWDITGKNLFASIEYLTWNWVQIYSHILSMLLNK